MAIVNTRVYWPVQAVGVASQAAPSTFKTIRGLQAFGLSGRLPITFIHEMGNLPTYASFEEMPEVEGTLEKVLDGYPPIYTLMTEGAATADLAGRSTKHCHVVASIHRDNLSRASGNQIAQVTVAKAWGSSVGWDFMINGPFKESVGFVSDNMTWITSSFTFTGHVSTHGVSSLVPAAAEGVDRRQHLVMADCLFPLEIPGITTSGLTINQNEEITVDDNVQFSVSFEQIRVAANLGRTPSMELGRKGHYCRYVEFPVDVTTTFDFKSKTGIAFNISNTNDNSTEQPIYLTCTEGLVLDLGTKNRLTSMNQTNGNAGARGSDQMLSFSYTNQNDLSVLHPLDPTVALRP